MSPSSKPSRWRGTRSGKIASSVTGVPATRPSRRCGRRGTPLPDQETDASEEQAGLRRSDVEGALTHALSNWDALLDEVTHERYRHCGRQQRILEDQEGAVREQHGVNPAVPRLIADAAIQDVVEPLEPVRHLGCGPTRESFVVWAPVFCADLLLARQFCEPEDVHEEQSPFCVLTSSRHGSSLDPRSEVHSSEIGQLCQGLRS